MLTRPSSSRLTARRIASITVLATCAIFALPAVGLVLFLRHRRAKRWDEKEYWWGVWAFVGVSGAGGGDNGISLGQIRRTRCHSQVVLASTPVSWAA